MIYVRFSSATSRHAFDGNIIASASPAWLGGRRANSVSPPPIGSSVASHSFTASGLKSSAAHWFARRAAKVSRESIPPAPFAMPENRPRRKYCLRLAPGPDGGPKMPRRRHINHDFAFSTFRHESRCRRALASRRFARAADAGWALAFYYRLRHEP